jgi:putative membrane protein
MDIHFNTPAAWRHEDEADAGYHERRERPDLFKGALAGFVGGLVGTWFMSEYQGLWSRYVDGAEPQSAGGRHDARDWEEKNEGDNANEEAAQALARRTAGRELTERELEIAAPLMHYAFGATVCAAYGAVAERARWTTAGTGTGFGTLVWAGADEIAMPLIGWSDPRRYPARDHLQSFTSHLVFGVSTELTRRAVRRMLR